ncbi:MAG TPA: hypothetical protein VIE67_07225 [Rudaea sp.]|jgi:hypothetical protein|uniref:hypothetical protein n=1 Tax=Rudaea sp. TaxID=2136325 RepID=UPI002F9259EA
MSTWLEQAWLARYLDRQLDGDETAWFEAYVLDKPELLAMIDADNRLRNALAGRPGAVVRTDASAGQDNRAGGATGAATNVATNPASISGDKRVVQFPKRSPLQSWLAVATALVLGLGIGGIGMRSLAPSQSASVIASPTRIIYDTMRGEATPPRVEHADSQSPYVLVEVAVPPGAEHITLHIEGVPDQPLTKSPDGFVSFLATRSTLSTKKSVSLELSINEQYRVLSIDTPNLGKNSP